MSFKIYAIEPFRNLNIQRISQGVDLHGNWTAEWNTQSNLLKDKVIIKQSDDYVTAEYAQQPIYRNWAQLHLIHYILKDHHSLQLVVDKDLIITFNSYRFISVSFHYFSYFVIGNLFKILIELSYSTK